MTAHDTPPIRKLLQPNPPHDGTVAQERYVRRIERRFNGLRDSGFYIFPLRDFALLLDWYERGVPADLVIGALESVFARASARGSTPKVQSIFYCRRGVEEAWEERRAALLGPPAASRTATGGARGAFQVDEILEHLDRAARVTAEAARSEAARAATAGTYRTALLGTTERLRELQDEIRSGKRSDMERLEDELVALEARILDVAPSALPPDEMGALEKDAENGLAGFTSRMSDRVRATTLRRALEAAIRRRLGLPRYSLFTLLR